MFFAPYTYFFPTNFPLNKTSENFNFTKYLKYYLVFFTLFRTFCDLLRNEEFRSTFDNSKFCVRVHGNIRKILCSHVRCYHSRHETAQMEKLKFFVPESIYLDFRATFWEKNIFFFQKLSKTTWRCTERTIRTIVLVMKAHKWKIWIFLLACQYYTYKLRDLLNSYP